MKEQPIVYTESIKTLVVKDIAKKLDSRPQKGVENISGTISAPVAEPEVRRYSTAQLALAAILQLTLNDPSTIPVTQRIAASALVIYGAYLLYRSFTQPK